MTSRDIRPDAFDVPLAPNHGVATREPELAGTLAICTASQVLATASVLALATVATIVSVDLGISAHLIGFQVSLIYCAGIIASALAGGMVKRYGSAHIAQLALYCAGIGLIGLASGILPVMVLASMLIGIGYAFNNPASSHILKRVTPARQRNLVYSIKQAGVPVGGILAALVMPPLSAVTGWRVALLVFAFATLALGAAFYPRRKVWDTDRDPTAAVVGSIWKGQKIVWSMPGLRALALLGLFYSAIQLCVSTFTVAMLVDEFGWTPIAAGTMVAGVQACGAVGRIVWGLVADWIKSGFAVLSFLGAVTAACCFFLYFATGTAQLVTLIVLCILGGCSIGWNGVLLAETAKLSPGAAGTLTGEVLTYTFIGVMVGPSTYALIYGGTQSYTLTFSFFGVLALAGTVVAAIAHFKVPHRH
ncbi:MFS transporter [Kaistia dalseonensis]|uniref:MFS family permease n=1 Tax=Kaistia dalseonensis TaxID=410840 RepID=A0ABU0H443_9HYPH|nr:MFS transporter [Kaistia dalseonensis]MCX5494476.1 MFS transporter [Kaistia dalseonensis]MDQ0437055.1 MFS family permease [Kaistia dalseonensis]